MNDALIQILESWLKLVIPTLTEVVRGTYGEADEPQPEAPYASIQLRTEVPESLNAYRCMTDEADGDEYKLYGSQRFQGTLVVNLYGDGALERCGDLVLSLSLPSVKSITRAADIDLRYIGGIGDTTDLGDTRWSESAQVEFALHRVRQAVVAQPVIETVNVPISTEE